MSFKGLQLQLHEFLEHLMSSSTTPLNFLELELCPIGPIYTLAPNTMLLNLGPIGHNSNSRKFSGVVEQVIRCSRKSKQKRSSFDCPSN